MSSAGSCKTCKWMNHAFVCKNERRANGFQAKVRFSPEVNVLLSFFVFLR